MNKHTLKQFLAGIAVVTTLFHLSSCSESWEAHYNTDPINSSDKSLWDQIKNDSNLSDFKAVLEKTHLYYKSNFSTISYADFLNANQSFTVWAPLNGSFNKDSLLVLCETPQGDSIVESAFLKNHIARYPYTVSETTNENILLLNRKKKKMRGFTFGEVPISTPNIAARNGILHVVDRSIPYYYNVYDGICNDPETSLLGKYLKSFQKDSLDELSSVASGIVDGKTVYVDSVMIKNNLLLSEMGYLNNEDSTYWMIAPTDAAWTEAYNRVEPYFNFAFINDASSLKDQWTKHTLINDAFFNVNEQKSLQDSMITTKYSARDVKYHVFHKPFEVGGILSNVQSKVVCSNGSIYKVNVWPFKLQEVFFHPIKVEAEYDANILAYTLSTLNVRTTVADSISNNAYIQVVPDKAASNPTITFQIPNTLSGKYDVCIVCVPKSVYSAPTNHTDSLSTFRPYKFKATLSYADEKGVIKTNTLGNLAFSNNPYKMDTVCLVKGFKFPTCNLGQDVVTVSLKIQCFITSKESATYNREMFFDCIYLKPNEE
jgi:hypothetical protein